jgi:hypothetical protein
MIRFSAPVARLVALCCFVGLLAAMLFAADARASSIVYVDAGGDLWLTAPDGSRQRQVTADGRPADAYSSPSMADDGTILALKAKHFVRLRPDGTRLGDPLPGLGSTVATSGNLFLPTGPLDPVISPDGRWIAYWFGTMVNHCRTWWDCSYEMHDQITWSHVDRFTDVTESGLVGDYRQPSWTDDGHLVAFNYGLAAETVATLDGPAVAVGVHPWFSDRSGQGRQISKSQVARTRDRMAMLVGSNRVGSAQEEPYLVDLPEGPGGPVRPVCYVNSAAPPARLFGWPTWSPDGSGLAWMESDGIHVADVPDLGADDVDCTTITNRVLTFGSEPFWGPADVPEDAASAASAAPRRPTRMRLRHASAAHAVGAPDRPLFAAPKHRRDRSTPPTAPTPEAQQRHATDEERIDERREPA